MSSRVVRADDPRSSAPIAWRQVGSVLGAPGASGAGPSPVNTAQIAGLEREYEQRVRAARAAGFAEGETAGRNRAATELQPVLERLARSIEELGQLRARLRREAEADMLRLSLAIARRVLRREMAVDPDAMHGLVLGALEKLQAQEICRVKVHPSHATQLRGWLHPHAGGPGVEVLADSACSPGDVIFETQHGNLDASVDSQLQEIERGLADRLRNNS